MLLQCVFLHLLLRRYRWMCDALGPRTRGQEDILWWKRWGRSPIITIPLDSVISFDLGRIDVQSSVSLTRLLGFLLIAIAFIIVTIVASRSSKYSWPVLI